jgi:hypothetical protein
MLHNHLGGKRFIGKGAIATVTPHEPVSNLWGWEL